VALACSTTRNTPSPPPTQYHSAIAYGETAGTACLHSFVFFAIQPLGLYLERHVLHIHSKPSWVGFAWVCLWFTLTAGPYFAEFHTPLLEQPGVDVSLPIFGTLFRKLLG
jgi:hypothetical protein